MASVTYKNVTKRFGDVVAVNDLSIEVEDKEFLVLVGPSGCGKTTALRLLAGLEELSDGEILIGDRLVNDIAPKDRDIAMVFQSYALYPHMSVYDNMAFGLKLRKMDKAEIKRRVGSAAEILGIETLLDRKPRQLSGGQRQRVAVGRAIVREPNVFLLDEPLSNLDAKLRVQTRAEISKLHKQLETTFIYVTHDQTEAMTMATRIAVMNLGILQQIDTPQNLYDKPENKFVAGFIGSPAMNFFDAKIIDENGSLFIDCEGFKFELPSDRKEILKDSVGKDVFLGIRPEDIHDANYGPGGDNLAAVKANVDVLELMGNEILTYFSIGENSFIGRIDPRSTFQLGEEVDIVFDLEGLQIFDKETELAIR
ncbi:MAG: sn-glycerol-3-phosphate ABC transporter ATP-binding protein UgpC [Chloroflexi bacterium]|jgi:multiple sugar transport system ATP-binding protein|nr:sn-glycerol-3-phosphate ABC transporter ATP-binding protein UgpC [Chloroflexota bacterium]MBT3670837.1 sn-glycerol-3-phosphate ABC transporter ATP-binding protein UgpC [Chloroflexota bacterium]MBT4002942.1 sn-glycerol-3-phosphate ABC transporter ATP-binding protein UgpC [Chloroflexota bacterium]MBT4305296.1 sn-glycerol-3-phosphate ABC transporter ATP-binding protein UgpC [Chloroflexota bacterium]MBT4683103.1 sn-glycerol-3-phosphate ABC transporter ATP-binding protein UgpC [Chloroflexota bact